jgi:predicted secreted protein
MKQRYHFGSLHDAALRNTVRVRGLIGDLDRVVRILDADIASEEERAGVSDPFNAAYPVLARTMTARRDNLKETIAILQRGLGAKLTAPV